MPSTLAKCDEFVWGYNPIYRDNKTLCCLCITPPNAAIDFVGSNWTLYVPAESIEEYKKTAPWNKADIYPLNNFDAIDKTVAKQIIVKCDGKTLKVEGLADNDIIHVVNTSGFTIYKGTEHEVDLNAPGVYIIKVNGRTLKFSVK